MTHLWSGTHLWILVCWHQSGRVTQLCIVRVQVGSGEPLEPPASMSDKAVLAQVSAAGMYVTAIL